MAVYYMLVTRDKYELPLSPPMRMREMTALLGCSESHIVWMCSPTGIEKLKNPMRKVLNNWLVVRIRLEEEEEEYAEK